jgi:metallo-beta-lactamase-like protein
VLVLPAHGKPFRGVRGRIDSMVNEHLARLSDLAEYCREPRRAVDVFPALYRAKITNDNLMFATGEAIAHLNYLIADGEIVAESDSDNVNWYRQS